MLSNYFIFFLDCYSPNNINARNTQKILCFCDYQIKDNKYNFSNIRIVKKVPDYPMPYSISPAFFEFDYDVDVMIPYTFKNDEEAIIYFTLKYCG